METHKFYTQLFSITCLRAIFSCKHGWFGYFFCSFSNIYYPISEQLSQREAAADIAPEMKSRNQLIGNLRQWIIISISRPDFEAPLRSQ